VSLTIDELAAATGTTTRRVRSLQTLGLLAHPTLRGRTGLYDEAHLARLEAVLALQDRGFSLEALRVLFEAWEEGRTLAGVLGVPETVPSPASGPDAPDGADTAELYGFAELQPDAAARRAIRQPFLSLVPTTVWDEGAAS
jgi:DNA-binding transcriptional MerR regulator